VHEGAAYNGQVLSFVEGREDDGVLFFGRHGQYVCSIVKECASANQGVSEETFCYCRNPLLCQALLRKRD